MSKQLLIVEDDVLMAEALEEIFIDLDYAVYRVGNGVDGLNYALQHPLNLIITDLNIPQMNGLEMIARIRQHDAYAQLPIIISTGNAELPQGNAYTHVIPKPFDVLSLINLVEQLT